MNIAPCGPCWSLKLTKSTLPEDAPIETALRLRTMKRINRWTERAALNDGPTQPLLHCFARKRHYLAQHAHSSSARIPADRSEAFRSLARVRVCRPRQNACKSCQNRHQYTRPAYITLVYFLAFV